eukprot:3181436-Prymnesium_polylepis.1
MAATVRRCVRDLVHEVVKGADAEADPGVDLDSGRAAARHADRVFRHAEAVGRQGQSYPGGAIQ